MLVFIILSLVLCGCRSDFEEQSVEEKQELARINNYRMSVADFKDRVDFILATKFIPVEPNEAKQELFDELIDRNVLIQEAQRQNLDKQSAFMREIERYWEQSLLNLLLKEKSQEISEAIHVEDSEVLEEYILMKRRLFAQLFILNQQKAAEELSRAEGDKFDALGESVKENIVFERPPQWWVLGDLPRYLEKPLFSLEVGQISRPVKCGSNWAVIRLVDEEKLEIEPYRDLALVLEKNIRRRKQEAAVEEWIKDLRNKASIKVDQKLLRAVDLQ